MCCLLRRRTSLEVLEKLGRCDPGIIGSGQYLGGPVIAAPEQQRDN